MEVRNYRVSIKVPRFHTEHNSVWQVAGKQTVHFVILGSKNTWRLQISPSESRLGDELESSKEPLLAPSVLNLGPPHTPIRLSWDRGKQATPIHHAPPSVILTPHPMPEIRAMDWNLLQQELKWTLVLSKLFTSSILLQQGKFARTPVLPCWKSWNWMFLLTFKSSS